MNLPEKYSFTSLNIALSKHIIFYTKLLNLIRVQRINSNRKRSVKKVQERRNKEYTYLLHTLSFAFDNALTLC